MPMKDEDISAAIDTVEKLARVREQLAKMSAYSDECKVLQAVEKELVQKLASTPMQ